MSNTLKEIAQQLQVANKKVQLIYAFNGTGKTRLSREFKDLISPSPEEGEVEELSRNKILYYNAFTEDLFYWDNDLEEDDEPKLKIQPNSFTDWVLREQGRDQQMIGHFQHLTDDKLTPKFNEDFSEVRFSYQRGNADDSENIKISKGEESCFIWSVFCSLQDLVVETLNIPEEIDRETDQFDQLEYVFIDDPVSSLDENHLIQLAVDISELVKNSQSDLKFIITTHNPLFYNVLHNEFGSDDRSRGYRREKCKKWFLKKLEDGTNDLVEHRSEAPFSYHLHLKGELEKAVSSGSVDKYHFNYLRNILEKTTIFLGYDRWGELLPQKNDGSANPYETRLVNLRSHSKYINEEVKELTEDDKRVLGRLVKHLDIIYKPDLTDIDPLV